MNELSETVAVYRRDAEEAFAGIAFLTGRAAREQAGWLDPATIRHEQLRKWWTMILEGKDHIDAAVDLGMEFFSWISTQGMRDELFGNYNVSPFAEKVAQYHWLQQTSAVLPPLARAIGDGNIQEVQTVLSSLQANLPRGATGVPTATDIGLEFVASLSDQNRTLFTGTPLDKATGGLWRSTLSVLCARPSVGKTAFGFQVARCVAQSGKRVLFVSMEMSRRALWARAACGSARIPYRDVLAKRITPEKEQLIIDANNELISNYSDYLMIDDKAQSTAELWRKVDQLKPDLIVCDHLRLFSDKNDREVKRLGDITWSLKRIAKEFDIHVMCLAQLNRQLEQRTDKHPTLADLRDSGEIEENADFVLGLHRDRSYLEQPKDKTPADLIVLKFRDGPSDLLIRLTFDGLGQWFDTVERR